VCLANTLDFNPVEKVEELLKILCFDFEWISTPSKNGKPIMCLNIIHSTPPICLLADGNDDEDAKLNVAPEAINYFNVMLDISATYFVSNDSCS